MRFLIIFIFTILINQNLFSQNCIKNNKRSSEAYRITDNNLSIDGKINERVWQKVEWQTNFTQREPYENAPPSEETFFKILYDDNYIYVAVKASDSNPDSIVQRLTRRDGMEGDMIGIQFDSYNDNLSAFTFAVNAGGVKNDYFVSNDGNNEDRNWDPIWQVKTSIDDMGWHVEMKIPLNQLRFSSDEKQVWGLQVMRYIYRKDEMSLWQFVGKDQSGWVNHFGSLCGIKNIRPKRQAEISPYLVTKAEYYKPDDANPFYSGTNKKIRIGADGKIGLTNDFTLDFTVLPDFGQVEADPSEVNLSAFESYFAEKRAFFTEGRNILDFRIVNGGGPNNLFYSRRIGRSPRYYPELEDNEYSRVPNNTPILGAVKITGKNSNGLSVGILETLSQEAKAEIDYNDGQRRQEVVEPMTNYFVTRIQKDIDNGNTRIGGIITSTNRFINEETLNFLHKNAYTGGFDFEHNWSEKTYYIKSNFTFSHVEGEAEAIENTQLSSVHNFNRPDADHLKFDSNRTSLQGTGGTIQIGKNGKGHWRYMARFNFTSPGLEVNDLGFLRKTDEINQLVWIGYRKWKPFSIFRSFNWGVSQWSGYDFGGTNLYKGLSSSIHAQFKNYWSISMGGNGKPDGISNNLLRGGPSMKTPSEISFWSNLRTDSRKKINFRFHTSFSKANENSNISKRYRISANYKPHDMINLSISPSFLHRTNNLQYVSEQSMDNQKRYVFAHLEQTSLVLSFRLNLSLTPDFTIQYYGQPFISSGKYKDYKRITNPKAENYYDRFQVYNKNKISYSSNDEVYSIDENLDGEIDYSFSKPDYNALYFVSNLVLRWEYIPGSTLYLVWSQNRSEYRSQGGFAYGENLQQMFNIFPHNIYLLKISFRLSA